MWSTGTVSSSIFKYPIGILHYGQKSFDIIQKKVTSEELRCRNLNIVMNSKHMKNNRAASQQVSFEWVEKYSPCWKKKCWGTVCSPWGCFQLQNVRWLRFMAGQGAFFFLHIYMNLSHGIPFGIPLQFNQVIINLQYLWSIIVWTLTALTGEPKSVTGDSLGCFLKAGSRLQMFGQLGTIQLLYYEPLNFCCISPYSMPVCC